jgi:hypothetical protein
MNNVPFKFILLLSSRTKQRIRNHNSITLEFNLHFQDNSLAYDDAKEVAPNQKQIVLYKLIVFMNKEKGMSYRKICAWFNRMGIKTYKGKKWSETGSHAHMIVKRMRQREHRLNVVKKHKTDSQITDFKIGEHYE